MSVGRGAVTVRYVVSPGACSSTLPRAAGIDRGRAAGARGEARAPVQAREEHPAVGREARASPQLDENVAGSASTSTYVMTRALLLAPEIGEDVPSRAAGHAGSVVTQLSSVLATSAMSPWAFWVKRGVNGRSARATAGIAKSSNPSPAKIRPARITMLTVRKLRRLRPVGWRTRNG